MYVNQVDSKNLKKCTLKIIPRRENMKNILTILVIVLVSMIGVSAEGWTPDGSVTVAVSSKFLVPVLSWVKYEKNIFTLDCFVNLPEGFSVEFTEYAGTDFQLDSDSADEIDFIIWKKFNLTSDTYLKLRIKYANSFPISLMNGNDMWSYDLFLDQVIKIDNQISIVAEVRTEYCHYVRSLSEGVWVVMPSILASYTIDPVFSIYGKVGALYNSKFLSFGELLSGQASFGIKTKVMKNLTLVVDASGLLLDVKGGDPRKSDVVYTASLTLGY